MESMEKTLLRFINEDLLAGAGLEVHAEDEIVLDGTVDSLGVARLIGFMESEYAISVPAEQVTIENFRTVTTMAEYLQRLIEPE